MRLAILAALALGCVGLAAEGDNDVLAALVSDDVKARGGTAEAAQEGRLIKEDLATASSEKDKLSSQLAGVKAELAAKQAAIIGKDDELEKAHKELRDLRQTVEELRKKADGEAGATAKSAAEAEAARASLQEELTTLQSRVQELTRQLSDERNRAAATERDLAEQRRRAEGAEQSLLNANAQLAGERERATMAEASLSASKQQLAERDARIAQNEQTIEEKTKAVAAAQQETQQTQEKLAASQADLARTRKENSDSMDHINATVMQLKNDLAGREGELVELKQHTAEVHAALEALQRWKQDPNLMEVLKNKAFLVAKSSPVLEGALNQSATHVVPHLQHAQQYASLYLNQTHVLLRGHASKFVPAEHLPIVSGVLTYGIVFFPLLLTLYCLTSIRAVLRLRPMLLFCHSYLLALTLGCGVAAIALDLDPLTLVHDLAPGVYTMMQISLLVFIAGYLILQSCAVFRARSHLAWLLRFVQATAALAIGYGYYHDVFTPAMLGKPPAKVFVSSIAVPYLVAGLVLSVILLLETRYLGGRSSGRSSNEDATSAVVVRIEAGPEAINGPIRHEAGLANGWLINVVGSKAD